MLMDFAFGVYRVTVQQFGFGLTWMKFSPVPYNGCKYMPRKQFGHRSRFRAVLGRCEKV